MSELDSVVFDLDGTLWDTRTPCAEAWNEALRARGMERRVTPDEIGSIMGLTHEQIFARMFPDLPESEIEPLSRECYRQEELFIARQGGQLFAGVKEGLARLGERFRLGIVSNCQKGYVEHFFHLTGLGRHFLDHECYGNTGRPKGENLRALLNRQGLNGCLYVGDTLGDEQAASLAGVPFAYVEYGFGDCDRPHYRFASFPALVDWLLPNRTLQNLAGGGV